MPPQLQTTLDAAALKQLIRALTCLSKYGDDLIILASPDRLLLHTTNSSQTAYGRFIYSKHFFSRYRVEAPPREGEYNVDGQLSTKSLLGVLKPRNIEKSVDKCDLSVVYGGPAPNNGEVNDDENDSLESKLIVRLHCKHGIVKTHRLLLSETTRHMAPNVPEAAEQSSLTIPPKNLKDILDHFNKAKAARDDPQLIWTFDVENVFVRTQETVEAKGKTQLATEFTVSADEFTIYEVYSQPATIAFHLREFNAVMTFAEAANHAITLQFTVPGHPLFIQPDNGEFYESLFIIALSQITMPNLPPNPTTATASNTQNSNRSVQQPQPQPQIQPQRKKRPYEPEEPNSQAADRSERSESVGSVNGMGIGMGMGIGPGNVLSQIRQRIEKTPARPQVGRSMKAVVTAERASSHARDFESPVPQPGGSMPPPSLPASFMNRPPSTPARQVQQSQRDQQGQFQLNRRSPKTEDPPSPPQRRASQIPLFLPGSQLSQADEEAIIRSGLGIENMDMDEFRAMLEDEGEEVGLNMDENDDVPMRESSLDIFEETQLPPTQRSTGDKVFKPLFDD